MALVALSWWDYRQQTHTFERPLQDGTGVIVGARRCSSAPGRWHVPSGRRTRAPRAPGRIPADETPCLSYDHARAAQRLMGEISAMELRLGRQSLDHNRMCARHMCVCVSPRVSLCGICLCTHMLAATGPAQCPGAEAGTVVTTCNQHNPRAPAGWVMGPGYMYPCLTEPASGPNSQQVL
jgi:hypothetical protein